MDEKTEIVSTLKTYLESKKEIIFAYIHGSFVEDIPYRDIDIALYLDESIVRYFDLLPKRKEFIFDLLSG